MKTLWARKIESTQTVLCELACGDLVRVQVEVGSVAASRKPGGPVVAVWPRYAEQKPTRRNKYVNVNCCPYNVEWWTA